jgi:hypothetical protein
VSRERIALGGSLRYVGLELILRKEDGGSGQKPRAGR